jgi:hypothetical protein
MEAGQPRLVDAWREALEHHLQALAAVVDAGPARPRTHDGIHARQWRSEFVRVDGEIDRIERRRIAAGRLQLQLGLDEDALPRFHAHEHRARRYDLQLRGKGCSVGPEVPAPVPSTATW